MFARLSVCGACASLMALLVATVAASQDEQKRPAPPKGYSWQELQEMRGAVLLPNDWHFRKSATRDALVYQVTREKPQKNAPFLTGLTINVARDVPQKTKVKPSVYSAVFVKDYIENAKVIEEPKVDAVGGMQRIACQVVKKFPKVDKEKLFRVRVTTMANDKTGTLYMMIFASPTEEWDEAYKIGNVLFNPVVFDSEF